MPITITITTTRSRNDPTHLLPRAPPQLRLHVPLNRTTRHIQLADIQRAIAPDAVWLQPRWAAAPGSGGLCPRLSPAALLLLLLLLLLTTRPTDLLTLLLVGGGVAYGDDARLLERQDLPRQVLIYAVDRLDEGGLGVVEGGYGLGFGVEDGHVARRGVLAGY